MVNQTVIQHRWVRLLLSIILVGSVCVQAQKKQTDTRSNRNPLTQPGAQASPVASSAVPTIATPQVAAEAMQLDQRLRTMPDRLVSEQSFAEIQKQVNSVEERTRELE